MECFKFRKLVLKNFTLTSLKYQLLRDVIYMMGGGYTL